MMAEVLVDLITAAIVPDTGEVIAFGQPTTVHRRSRGAGSQTLDQFGLLTERAVLVEQFTVEQNLAIPLSLAVEDMSADLRARVGGARDGDRTRAGRSRRQSGVLPPVRRGCACASAAPWP